MLGHGDQAHIGQPVERREFEAGGPKTVKARLFGKAGRERTMRRHDANKAAGSELDGKRFPLGHDRRLSLNSIDDPGRDNARSNM
jgi:hypothetical protein